MNEPTNISFERGYRRLEEIAELVNSDKVPVDQLCDLFAEGKGLDKALTAYLDGQKGRIERIEKGEEIHAFKVMPTSEGVPGNPIGDGDDAFGTSALASPAGEQPVDTGGFQPEPPGESGSDDDIPF